MRSLVWFRRDLRINDNQALFHSVKSANNGVVALALIAPDQWREHDDAPCKVQFWLENLEELSKSLAKLNIPLIIKKANTFSDAPKAVVSVAQKYECGALFFNQEYEVNERSRDQQVVKTCEAAGIITHQFHDRVVVPPKEIETKTGNFYSVFTPYRKVWDTRRKEFSEESPKPAKQKPLNIESSEVPKSISGFDFSETPNDLWKPGEAEAHRRLKKFAKLISDYGEARDLPAIEGTSQLSPYLAAGVVSPRQCVNAAIAACQGRLDSNPGAATWVSELTWRDFYAHVLIGFPRVSKHQPFKEKTNAVPWRDSEADLTAWKTGQTGYPIVDAGMRQLNQTGWMHNRLRMVTAMFLTKHLLIDWRLGEKYFMEKLIDGDLAANNGGWQWSASTGTDAVPYFRIFNPFSQSKRFDKDGKFIKRLCPELNEVPAGSLHDATKLEKAIANLGLAYPKFIVDHKSARERALKAFKELGYNE